MIIKGSAADYKLKELKRLRDKVVEIRSRAWLYNDLPPDVLTEVEAAAVHLNLAVSKFMID